MTNQLSAAIAEAADLIGTYNPILAARFRAEPFRRVDLARAFAAGFKRNEHGDFPAFCYTIIQIAYADKESRTALVGA